MFQKISNKKIVCVIPARLASTRFPRKVLEPLDGKPLVLWALDAARSMRCFDDVVCAVDSEEVAACVEKHGGRFIMTSKECASGTERILELHAKRALEGDVWVNWQADEPFINEQMIAALLQSCTEQNEDIWTLKKKINSIEDVLSPHVVKVICDHAGRALYFSRSSIPYQREEVPNVYYKHIGLYAYSQRALSLLQMVPECALERAEKLEQLRFLYHGLYIRVHDTEHETLGIDVPEHLALAAQRI